MPRRTPLATAALAGVIVLALAGCATSETAPSHGGARGEPTLTGQALVVTGIDEPDEAMPPAVRAWYTDGTLVVTTMGSGSCPWAPEIDEIRDDTIDLALERHGDEVCTDDFTPTTFERRVDQDLAGYTVIVTYED